MSETGGELPGALAKRERVVQLEDGGSVVVRRWNWAREQAALDLVMSLIGKVDWKELSGGDPFASAASMMRVVGRHLADLVKLSMSPDDFAGWDDMAPIDRATIFEAIFDLNRIGDYAKKVKGALSKFKSGPANGQNGSP
jgi:hypothetical protein